MYDLRVYINKSIFEKFLSKIEKIVKIFSISDKFFLKLVYYCMLLEHTLVKSLKESKIYIKEREKKRERGEMREIS